MFVSNNSKFCSICGGAVEQKTPDDDNRVRDVCTQCGAIHYCNPKIIAGAILESDDKILLCKRSIEPRSGYWTVPAGFMENAESVIEAAAREAKEEACAGAEALYLQGIYSLKYVDQVYMMYRGLVSDGKYMAGHETSEAALFDADALPWDDIAFAVIRVALQLYLEDRERMDFRVHEVSLFRDQDGGIKSVRYI